jgi:DNA-binding transcriptional ArsR family regulator
VVGYGGGIEPMSKRAISAYRPSNTDAKTRERIFVQRHNMLKRVVRWCEESMLTGNKHHLLFVGPRGSGKTHLVSMVQDRMLQNPELLDKMRIAWLGEDSVFTGLIDVALEIADELASQYPHEFRFDYRSHAKALTGDEAAQSILDEVISRLGDKSILLIMENLDRAFHGLGDTGQKKWRAFLQETGRIATVATSQQLFEDIASRDAAFYGFFEIFHLEPLAVEDARQLMTNISRENNNTKLLQFLATSEGRYRVHALQHLAGGNHRMYVMLSESLTQESLDELVAAFEELAEDLTPYFQERVRSLSPQQARIVQSLCNASGAITVKAVAEDTLIAERNVSKQLGELKQKGYVVSEKRGKESYYEMAEPLMRLCLELKRQRRNPLQFVAAFLRAWYSASSIHADLPQPSADSDQKTRAFAYKQTALQSSDLFQDVIREELDHEFETRIKSNDFAEAPNDLLKMVLGREPSAWPELVKQLVPIYAQYGALDRLGSGLTESIAVLDAGGYSESQLDVWHAAWRKYGEKHEELSIPLAALGNSIQVIKTGDDRPLFNLPLEIRKIVRPLLKNTLSNH